MMPDLPVGKINPDILERLLSDFTGRGGRVVIGAGIGEDATIIDMGNNFLVAKTDPITHVSSWIGYYAVNINANDIAAMGGKPLWFLATILLPPDSSAEALERIFSQLHESCNAHGIIYCGGHTEVTSSVSRPVVIGQMLGEVEKDLLKPTSGAKLGDDLVMTKSAAIEATAIIALEKEEELQSHFSKELIANAQGFLLKPGISVLNDARIAAPYPEVHALHDPTEGGITTGISEIAAASSLGVKIDRGKIFIAKETQLLCERYDVDPLGTFASGALLITVSPNFTEQLLSELRGAGIPATRIGVMEPKEAGLKMEIGNKSVPLPLYTQDEISKIFG
jgi:hydrogenase maturation factor